MKENETIAVLAGGVPATVKHTDGSVEDVQVRKIPMREMPKLALAWGKEDAEIDLYAEKPTGWNATLDDDSWERIVDTGRQLNEVPFGRWYARQERAAKAMGMDLVKTAQAAMQSILQQPTNS